jgi:chemotaxis protein methyltransferase CheR
LVFRTILRVSFCEKGIQNELAHLYDVITTNKTEFFREQSHFDYLTRTVIPQLITREGIGIKHRLALWSAGCATGEEPYTLAIVLNELKTQFPDFQFSILASDISTIVLEKAKLAVYHESQIGMIPEKIKKKYFLHSKDKSRHLVRLSRHKTNVRFRRINQWMKFYCRRKWILFSAGMC